jgi:hypothetical protein
VGNGGEGGKREEEMERREGEKERVSLSIYLVFRTMRGVVEMRGRSVLLLMRLRRPKRFPWSERGRPVKLTLLALHDR